MTRRTIVGFVTWLRRGTNWNSDLLSEAKKLTAKLFCVVYYFLFISKEEELSKYSRLVEQQNTVDADVRKQCNQEIRQLEEEKVILILDTVLHS